jgi:hypothetical protein
MLDQLNPTELLIFAGLFIVEADELPKGDPKKVELLQAASLSGLSRQAPRRFQPPGRT